MTAEWTMDWLAHVWIQFYGALRALHAQCALTLYDVTTSHGRSWGEPQSLMYRHAPWIPKEMKRKAMRTALTTILLLGLAPFCAAGKFHVVTTIVVPPTLRSLR